MRHILLFLIAWPLFPLVYAQQASNFPDVFKQHPYITIVIPYQDEASALTFSRENSPFFKDITDLFEVKQTAIASNSKAGTVNKQISLTAVIQIPQSWQQKEKFIVLTAQKTAFRLLINGKEVMQLTKATPAKINITSLLQDTDNRIELVTDSKQTFQKSFLQEISLLATSQIHVELFDFAQAYSHLPRKYTDWNGDFTIRNYGAKPYYKTNGYILKLYDDSLNVVENYVHLPDTADKKPPKPLLTNEAGEVSVFFHGLHYLKKWTAETPDLYSFTIEGRDVQGNSLEVVSGKAGFRAIRTDGEKLYLGNIPVSAPITFKAVLYKVPKDLDSLHSGEIMREQVRALKEHHVNTIILPEYTGSSLLYKLCDELGIYIIQRFDFTMPEGVDVQERARIREAHWQRIRTLADILRNHPSVIAWQIEKEYNSQEDLVNFSLGVSGAVAFYNRTTFDRRPGSYSKRLPLIKDPVPDWNKLNPKQRAALKIAYRPVHLSIRQHSDNTLYLANQYDFTHLDNLYLVWEIKENGKTTQQGEIENIETLPKKELAIPLPFRFEDYKTKSGYSFAFSLRLKQAVSWVAKGDETLSEEFVFTPADKGSLLIKKNELPEK